MFPFPGELASSEVAKDNLVLGVNFLNRGGGVALLLSCQHVRW
jgi:hypothetical protein